MAVPTLPADLQNPWGQVLRDALVDISNRADQGISDAADVGGDLDDLEDDVATNTTSITSHNTRISNLETSNATKAADSVVVKLTGNQTIAGTKTFTSAPVIPDNSFAISKITGLQTAINAKANANNPVFSGTITGIDKTDIGLNLVDNVADVNKPISNATQTALNLKASTSDLNSAIQTHNHTGGANGVAIPQSAVSGLSTTLNGKQATIATGSYGSTQTTVNTAEWTINYMGFRRWGATVVVSMAITTKFVIGNGSNTISNGTGNIANHTIATINSSSVLSDIFTGSGNSFYSGMIYPLSSAADGPLATGYINSVTGDIIFSATTSYNYPSGYTFSLGGVFMLNSDS